MRLYIANEARSAQLAIIISYPASASVIVSYLKTPTKSATQTDCVGGLCAVSLFFQHTSSYFSCQSK